MGGMGSGNRLRWGTRNTVEDMKALQIGKLARDGWLGSGQTCRYGWTINGRATDDIRITAEPGRLILQYRHRTTGCDWHDKRYPVHLDTTPCHFGGVRHWFRCPALGCGRRVATLYGGTVFACRHCHRLAYPSENESTRDRAVRKADKIRDRLGWPHGIFEGSGWGKPKHMQQTTFDRLAKDYDAVERGSLATILLWLDRHN